MDRLDVTCGGLLPLLPQRENAKCVYDATSSQWETRAELRSRALILAESLKTEKKALVFLLPANRIPALVALLAAAAAGHAVALIDPDTAPAALAALVAAYEPELVISSESKQDLNLDDYDRWRQGVPTCTRSVISRRRSASADSIAEQLLILLSTSGTTGSAKLVRLAREAITTNARQIGMALNIDCDSVGIAHLPMHYSYGLSVVTSHLNCGAAIYLTENAMTTPDFWSGVAAAGGTHLPGVPFHYAVLARLGIAKLVPPSVTVFTQAGSALDLKIQRRIHADARARGASFYVMYGQTEAGPRMTTLPSGAFEQKVGSVGQALSGGRLSIVGDDGRAVPCGTEGNVIYEGPNVMLGYALSRADLARGDDLRGRLETGDRGYLDGDSYLFIVGRTKRIAKVFGLRLSLDEIERRLRGLFEAAVIEGNEKIIVVYEQERAADIQTAAMILSSEYKLPISVFQFKGVRAIPRKVSGKTDYALVRDLL
jgi:acyl-coenzyme A synthetase/AMP-(fatty) acid ligase